MNRLGRMGYALWAEWPWDNRRPTDLGCDMGRSTKLRWTSRTLLGTVGAFLFVLGVLPATAAQAYSVPPGTEPVHLSTTLEGCRNNGGIVLPIGGKFVCPDAAYTTGNLGKGWNELDLVPHRLTTSLGSQSAAATDYNLSIAADGITGGDVGYDVISVPEVNGPKSDASCSVSAGPQSLQGDAGDPFGGGTDTVIYRDLTVHQAKGTTCVFDYYERLALGSHLYPGSSLQSYLGSAPDLGGSKKTVSIPVNEIQPQSLTKDMTATQGSNHIWNITKDATPASLDIPDTCGPDRDAHKAHVGITVSWERLPAEAGGPITILTHVYATNPSARVITTTVVDDIRSSTTVLDSAGPVTADVPANTANFLMLTHQTQVPAGTGNLNDVATGTYTDLVTGVPVPGNTSATASADVQLTGPTTNASAIISDTESISGPGLTFSVDSTSGASGSFGGGYTPGTPTTGPVNWTSSSQNGSGSVTFDKTVYAEKGTITSSGNLHDVATLTGSDGFTAQTDLDVGISVDTKATLTIDKSIPDVLQGAETASFTFQVKDASDTLVATRTISFSAGETSDSAVVTGLTPGAYTVSEDPATGWDPLANEVVDLSGDACSGTATFRNDNPPASASVRKVTDPAGFSGDWTFTLTGTTPSGPIAPESVTTTDAGAVNFTTSLGEGSYVISEDPQSGWSSDGGNADCSFTVDLPADAGTAFECVFTNTFEPSISLTKGGDRLSKIGDPVTYTFDLENTSSQGGPAGAPDLTCTIEDPAIGFSRTVTLAPGATDHSSAPFTIPAGAVDPFPNTATATCHYPGQQSVVASDESSHGIELFQPGIKLTKTGPSAATPGDLITYDITIENTASADAPNLVLDSFSDSLVAGVTPPAACDDLASGASCSFSYTYTVQAGDPTPLENTATVHYHPAGFPNDITDSDTWNVDVYRPSVKITKTGPESSKVGDDATYDVTIENTSSANTPSLVLDSFSDSLVAGVTPPAACDDLASGASCSFSYTYTVQPGDPDPLVNTASVTYHAAGTQTTASDDDTWTTELFQPGIKLTKTGPSAATPGDLITYDITIENTASADAPNLVLDSFSDSLVAGVTPPAACDDLASGASCSFSYTYTRLESDPNPLVNTATVHYHPAGFPNDITDSDTWNVALPQVLEAFHTWEIRTNMPNKVRSGGFDAPDTAIVRGRLTRHCGFMTAKFRADGVLVDTAKVTTNFRTLVKLYLDGTLIQSKIGQSHDCSKAPVTTTASPSPTASPDPEPSPSPTRAPAGTEATAPEGGGIA